MLMSESVLPMFSSRILMVSCRIFKSFSHLEFIFVHGVRVCSSFIDLHAAVQVSQQFLLKSLSFPILCSCLLCQRLIDHRCQGLFLGSLFCSKVCVSVLVPVPHCLDDCGFVILPEVWESYASCLIFVPQSCFGSYGFLRFHINFWIVCSSSVKNVIGNLIGIELNVLSRVV